MLYSDSIVALATPSGAGAIAVIRISGPEAITIGNSVFKSIKNKDLSKQKTHTLHLGHIMDDKNAGRTSLYFKGPNSTPVKIRSRYPATVPRIFNNRLYSCCWMPHG
jgi:tRNA modification GTPase